MIRGLLHADEERVSAGRRNQIMISPSLQLLVVITLIIYDSYAFSRTFYQKHANTVPLFASIRPFSKQHFKHHHNVHMTVNNENGALETKSDSRNPIFSWLSGYLARSKLFGSNQLSASNRTPRDAVIVFGATGKTGQSLVQQLLSDGRHVVAVGRNLTKLNTLYQSTSPNDNLFVHSTAIDVTNPSLLEKNLNMFKGVSQLVLALGPSAFDSNTNSSSRNLDFLAVQSLVTLFEKQLNTAETPPRNPLQIVESIKKVVDFEKSQRNLSSWRRLDDVIMGGRSSSQWTEENSDGKLCRWKGQLVTTGGGFCGTVYSPEKPISIKGFDGVCLRVRGDGGRYKFRIKPDDVNYSRNEYQYQAVFDTFPDTWTTVYLPFTSFTAVKRNDVLYRAPRLSQTQSLTSLGLVYSKFTFNEVLYTPNTIRSGVFQLDVASIGLFRLKRPDVILVSSAGAERIHKISKQERLRDVPIVQLNPQGILNWKYRGEQVVRSSNLAYTIIRPAGLVSPGASTQMTPEVTELLQQKRKVGC
jgi:hypothetical protein